MNIGFFSESSFECKIQRDFNNMRTEYAWYVALDGTHHNIFSTDKIADNTYDIGIVIIPKTNVEAISDYPMIQEMKRVCKRVGTMQEGPHWYFQDFTMEQQIWFYNLLMDVDFIWCHNEIDKLYYKGLTDKKCYVNPTLMLEDQIHTTKIELVIKSESF